MYCFQGIQTIGTEAHNHNNLTLHLTFEPYRKCDIWKLSLPYKNALRLHWKRQIG